ncbi:MAG TPA: plastocyanin/azurin family copper-binding protein [Candidatus Polarisedimenticolia bacterium]|nr:plastocyanin/azurin family copper-binding protein [Candidatus Polarisedimenticolia bacterium]
MVRRLAPLIVTLLAAAFVLVPTAAAGDPCFHEMNNRPPTSSVSTSHVEIDDCVFLPTVARVPVGTTVTWANGSFQAHEIVGSNLTWGAHDKLLQPGDSIGWTFDAPGVYAYSCMIHPGMSGAIVVGEATSTAAGAGSAAPTDATPTSANGLAGAIGPLAAGGSLLAIAGLAVIAFRRRAADERA